jgi:hypothetical protein
LNHLGTEKHILSITKISPERAALNRQRKHI